MIWQIAWKNIWRNKMRSLVVIVAIALGMFGGIFSVAVMMGMVDQRTETALGNELGHLQIYHPNYLKNNEIIDVVDHSEQIKNAIDEIESVKSSAARIRVQGMANYAGYSSGVVMYGVNPADEKKVFSLYKQIASDGGTYLSEDSKNSVVIGAKLAKELRLVYYQLSDDILEVLSHEGLDEEMLKNLTNLLGNTYRLEKEFDAALEEVLSEKEFKSSAYAIKKHALHYRLHKKIRFQFQDANGDLSGGMYRVCGVFNTGNNLYDGLNVFVNRTDLQEQSGIPDNASHEIIVRLNTNDDLEVATEQISKIPGEFVVKSWSEMEPMLKMMNELMWVYSLFFIALILFALSFGIINTMLMAILERTREIGMLMAIGMNKKRVFNMIMLETILLTLTGAVVGTILGSGVIVLTARNGIDLSSLYGDGLAEMGFSAVLTPVIHSVEYIQIVALVILAGILSSIYPARKALKLNPVTALRSE